MTRINCVPVECLSPKHKLAEYKEITRPFNKVIARLEKGEPVPIVKGIQYTLGTGHETFFFNKLKYLMDRYEKLLYSLLEDGINIDEAKFRQISNELESKLVDTPYWNDWTPTPQDMYVNMARLCHRHFKTDLSEFN